MLPSFMTKPYVRKRYPVTVDHGTEDVDYTGTPTQATFYGSVQPGTGSTDVINRNGAEVVKTIYGQPNSDVEHRDLVEVAGKTYWVNGEPERWDVGVLDHVVIRLSRWLG